MNTGEMHLAHPSSSELHTRSLHTTVLNAYSSLNASQNLLFVVSEYGSAESFTVSFRKKRGL